MAILRGATIAMDPGIAGQGEEGGRAARCFALVAAAHTEAGGSVVVVVVVPAPTRRSFVVASALAHRFTSWSYLPSLLLTCLTTYLPTHPLALQPVWGLL